MKNFLLKVVFLLSKNFIGKKSSGLLVDFLAAFNSKSKKQKKGVMIIRLDVIGDFIMWLDQAKEYRALYSNQKIVLVADKSWSSFALQFPYWDDIWPFDCRKFINDPCYRYDYVKKVIDKNFDVVLQVTHVRFLHGDYLVKASKANQRIGSIGDLNHKKKFQKKHSDKWYTDLLPATDKPLMMLLREAEFIRALGVSDYKAKVADISTYLHPFDGSTLLPDAYCVFFPGAGGVYKRWPVDRFRKLAELVYELTNLPIVICGGPGEESLAREITNDNPGVYIDFSGKTTLNDLAWVIKNASFLVANDTGAIHIAAAVNTPSICILGGGQYGRCLPYQVEDVGLSCLPVVCIHKMDCFGCNWKMPCLSKQDQKAGKPVPCIELISVDELFSQVRSVWQSLK